MDQFLADYYGTGATYGEPFADNDIEKMAQLTLLTKEAAAEGIDLSQFSDGELVAMANDLYGNGSTPNMEKEAAAKFEEADFLGRVMAHSFNQELGEIEKQAKADLLQRGGAAVDRGLTAAKRYAMGLGGRAREGERGISEWLGGKLYSKKGLAGDTANRAKAITSEMTSLRPGSASPIRDLAEAEMKRRRGRIAGGVAGGTLAAGGIGGGIYAATRDKKSADSAFEQLVIERANEHLAASGLLDKTAGSEDFETTVDRAALELLEANGYPVEWY
jgi:hypothetical protein